MANDQNQRWELILGVTKSPIERAFLFAFCDCAVANGYDVTPRACDPGTIGVVPQEEVGPYFLDFGIHFRFFGTALDIAIECDGYAFHRPTLQRRDYDARRNAVIRAHGYRLRRISGSEIHMSAGRCAMEILGEIMVFQSEEVAKAAVKGLHPSEIAI
jgi:very-short-patch-repair endonuclease